MLPIHFNINDEEHIFNGETIEKYVCHVNGSCPFSFTDESEYAQNLGCLPTPLEIVNMRQIHGKTWACHSDTSRPCAGAMEYMKEKGMKYKQIDPEMLNEESNWENI